MRNKIELLAPAGDMERLLNLKDQYDTTPLHVDVNIVSNDVLDLEDFKAWRPEMCIRDRATIQGAL